MSDAIHPAAPHHLPYFIPGPDGSDPMFTHVTMFLVVALLLLGTLYFRLHALPEHFAHRANHTQMQLVAILTLLALVTHNHLFWLIALVLAVVQIPDFTTPLADIARALRGLDPEEAPKKDDHQAGGH